MVKKLHSLFDYGRKDRCPRGVWRRVPVEMSPAFARAEVGPARGSRPVEDPHLRPHRRNAPILLITFLLLMLCQFLIF